MKICTCPGRDIQIDETKTSRTAGGNSTDLVGIVLPSVPLPNKGKKKRKASASTLAPLPRPSNDGDDDEVRNINFNFNVKYAL